MGELLVRLGGNIFRESDELTIDGTTGKIYRGPVKFVLPDAVSHTESDVSGLQEKSRLPDIDEEIDPLIGISL